MKAPISLRPLALAALPAVTLLPLRSAAQDDVNSYRVGERVEYKAESYPEVWKEGTVIVSRQSPVLAAHGLTLHALRVGRVPRSEAVEKNRLNIVPAVTYTE